MRYTFGGMPGSDALYWDDATKRQLGDIVFLLLSGFPEKRMKAYQQWYELKRRFMVEEWERYIAELDTYRIQNNHRPVVEMIEEAGREVVKYNKPLPKEPEKDPIVMVPKTAEVWAPEPEKKW